MDKINDPLNKKHKVEEKYESESDDVDGDKDSKTSPEKPRKKGSSNDGIVIVEETIDAQKGTMIPETHS